MRLVSLLAALALPSCVVTTIEGPGDPPRVAPAPDAPKAGGSEGPVPELETGAAAVRTANEPREISARHILVSYQGALRAGKDITRTKAEALARAQEALAKARADEDFAELVRQYSDEPGAAERGGELGRFRRGMMVKPFEDAAFKLEPGQVSDVVETDFGFHVIERTE